MRVELCLLAGFGLPHQKVSEHRAPSSDDRNDDYLGAAKSKPEEQITAKLALENIIIEWHVFTVHALILFLESLKVSFGQYLRLKYDMETTTSSGYHLDDGGVGRGRARCKSRLSVFSCRCAYACD